MIRMNGHIYLRPGNMLRDFEVAVSSTTISETGRQQTHYEKKGTVIRGVLSDASSSEEVTWYQMGHPITHKIVQRGSRKAKETDKLIMGERIFLIQGADDVSDLGMVTIYYVQERYDLD